MHTCIAYSNLVWQQYRIIIAGVEPQKYPSGPVLLLEDAHWGLSIRSGNLFSHELCWGGQSNCNLTCTHCSGTVQQVNTLLIKLPLLHFCYTMKYLYIKRHSSGDWKKLSSGSAWLCWSSCFPSLILPNSDLKATLCSFFCVFLLSFSPSQFSEKVILSDLFVIPAANYLAVPYCIFVICYKRWTSQLHPILFSIL